jgi:hypothetical protein
VRPNTEFRAIEIDPVRRRDLHGQKSEASPVDLLASCVQTATLLLQRAQIPDDLSYKQRVTIGELVRQHLTAHLVVFGERAAVRGEYAPDAR